MADNNHSPPPTHSRSRSRSPARSPPISQPPSQQTAQQQQQQQQQPQQNHEIMYCHSCDNEWYRHEHGLACPECGSDFTEVIEEGSDPRDPPEEDLSSLEAHNPWAGMGVGGVAGGANGGGGVQWIDNGQGGLRGTFRREVELGGQGQQQGQGQGFMSLFTPMLQGLLGAGQQQVQQRAQGGYGEGQGEGQEQGQRSAGNTRHGHFSGPGFTMSYTTTTSGGGGTMRGGTMMGGGGGGMIGGGMENPGLHPRDANNPQPMQNQPDDLQNILNQMFTNIGAGPGMGGPPQHAHHQHPHHAHAHPFGGGGGAAGMPFGNLFQLLGLPGFGGGGNPGQMGDAVFTQEALDRVISQLMEQHTTGNAPGPASAAAIANLSRKHISSADLDPSSGKADCSICMENVEVGGGVSVLPCGHWFHGECVGAWLGEHDTCPQCRRGIMPKAGEEGRVRAGDEEPRFDMSRPEVAGGGRGGELGSQGPGLGQGSAGSAGASGAGGVFGRMRQAFGGAGGSGAGPSGGPPSQEPQ